MPSDALLAKIQWYAPLAAAGEDEPIRIRRVVGQAGPVSLAVGECLHDVGAGETVRIEVEQVEVHGES